jgi:hypothetical protein
MVQGTCVCGFSRRGGMVSAVQVVTLGSLQQEARKLLQNLEQGLRITAHEYCSHCDVTHASRLGPLDLLCRAGNFGENWSVCG